MLCLGKFQDPWVSSDYFFKCQESYDLHLIRFDSVEKRKNSIVNPLRGNVKRPKWKQVLQEN